MGRQATRAVILVGCVGALGGCGATSFAGAGDGADAGSIACVLTFNGAFSKTVSCSALAVADSSGIAGFHLWNDASTSSEYRSFFFKSDFGPGALEATTYESSSVFNGSAWLSAGPGSWEQYCDILRNPDLGSFSVRITDPGIATVGHGPTAWPNAHGTLDITLEPVPKSGTSGTVSAHASF